MAVKKDNPTSDVIIPHHDDNDFYADARQKEDYVREAWDDRDCPTPVKQADNVKKGSGGRSLSGDDFNIPGPGSKNIMGYEGESTSQWKPKGRD